VTGDGSGGVRSLGSGQEGLGRMRLGQMRSGQMGSDQMGFLQMSLGQMKFGYTYLVIHISGCDRSDKVRSYQRTSAVTSMLSPISPCHVI
jgi:hypothetical protein